MAQKKFEQALEELESIVQRLQDTELPLDDALALFEEGISLSRSCSARLEEAERKVELLLKDGAGTLSSVPFDPAKDAEEA